MEEQDQVLRTSDDRIGIGGLVLSRQSRTPTSAAGGLEITIGDRALNYREEKVIEAYYTCV